MSDTKSRIEGITVEDFHRLVEDPLVTLGRALAPSINVKVRMFFGWKWTDKE